MKYTVTTSFPHPKEDRYREDIVEASSEEEAINAVISDLRISFILSELNDGSYFFRLYKQTLHILYYSQIKTYETLLRACGLRYTVMEYYPYDVILTNKYWARSGADAEQRYLTEDHKKEQYDEIEALRSEERKGKRAYRNVIVSGEDAIIVEGKRFYSSMIEAEEAFGRDDNLRISPQYGSGRGELYFNVEIGIYPRFESSSDPIVKEVIRVHKKSFLEQLGITFAAEAEKKKKYEIRLFFCGFQTLGPVKIIEANSESEAIRIFKQSVGEGHRPNIYISINQYFGELVARSTYDRVQFVATEIKE